MSQKEGTQHCSGEIELRAQSAPWRRTIKILALVRDRPSPPVYRGDIVWTKFEPFASVGPTVEIKIDQAQTLMDDLWACGLRPGEGEP